MQEVQPARRAMCHMRIKAPKEVGNGVCEVKNEDMLDKENSVG